MSALRSLTRLLAIAPIVLLAACGSGGKSSTSVLTTALPRLPQPVGPATAHDLVAVRQAAAHTLELRAAVSLRFVSPPSVPYPPVAVSGTFDFPQASGQELVHDSVGTGRIVLLPTRIFVERPPSVRGGLPRGRPWITAGFSERFKSSRFLAQFLQRLEQDDPAVLLAVIAWGSRDAAPLGRSSVDGVQADGYLVRVDASRAMATASAMDARDYFATDAFLKQALGAALGVPPVVRVWIDSSNRVVSVRAATVGSAGGTTFIALTSFGTAVKVSPPARKRTVELGSLLGRYDNG